LGGPASKYSTTDAYDQSGGLGASSKYSSSLPHAGAYASDYSPPLTSSSYGTPSTYSSSLGSDSLGLASGSYGSSLGGSYEAAGGYGASGGYGARDPFSPNITDQGLSYAPAYNPSSGGYGSSGAYGSQGGYESSSGGYGPSAGGYGSSSKVRPFAVVFVAASFQDEARRLATVTRVSVDRCLGCVLLGPSLCLHSYPPL
jgi:hypothetical protein